MSVPSYYQAPVYSQGYAYPQAAMPPAPVPCGCADCMRAAYYYQAAPPHQVAAPQYYPQAYPQAQPQYEQNEPQVNQGSFNGPPSPNSQNSYTHSPYSFTTGKKPANSSRGSAASDVDSDGLSDTKLPPHEDEKLSPSTVSVDGVKALAGKIVSVSLGPHGSSYLQAALRSFPTEVFPIISQEIKPSFCKLLLDQNACYVVKKVVEMMEQSEAIALVNTLSQKEDVLTTLCTKDLHSRRMVQFVIEFAGAENCRFLYDLIMRRPMSIVRTQQGCITMQRILDAFSPQDKEAFFVTVRANFMEYLLDPFGNYIIQYMLSEGNRNENSRTIGRYCRGQMHTLVCHKYASNVIEKCFGHIAPELQSQMIGELFNAQEDVLRRILTDNSANYVVQAAIRNADAADASRISCVVAPLLPSVPYGRKIHQRIQKRLAELQ